MFTSRFILPLVAALFLTAATNAQASATFSNFSYSALSNSIQYDVTWEGAGCFKFKQKRNGQVIQTIDGNCYDTTYERSTTADVQFNDLQSGDTVIFSYADGSQHFYEVP